MYRSLSPGFVLDPAEPGGDDPGEAEEGASLVLPVLVVGHKVPGGGHLVNFLLPGHPGEHPLVLALQGRVGLLQVAAGLIPVQRRER